MSKLLRVWRTIHQMVNDRVQNKYLPIWTVQGCKVLQEELKTTSESFFQNHRKQENPNEIEYKLPLVFNSLLSDHILDARHFGSTPEPLYIPKFNCVLFTWSSPPTRPSA